MLHRSLLGSRALIGRSLAEVRLTQGVQNPEQFLVSGFIDELAPAAKLEANARRIDLAVLPVEDGVAIEADRQVLAAVVMNLLQNAFKFTRPRTTVTLRVGPSAERVLIEVQDECGGLPSGNVDELFRPFEQRSARSNRAGPRPRLQPLGRRSEQRPDLCAQPAGQGLRLHHRPAAAPGSRRRQGLVRATP